MAFIDKIESNESDEHKEAKLKLFNRLVNGKIIFTNQFGKEIFVTPTRTWSKLYMEAYAYADTKTNDPYDTECDSCFYGTKELLDRVGRPKEATREKVEKALEYCHANRFDTNEFNGNLHTVEDDCMSFKTHPCNICKFKGRMNCVAIFDIACSLKGKYTIAIEVVKTSHCSKNKIKFCMENNLFLIEVNYMDILNLKDDEDTLECRNLWWYEKYKGVSRKFLTLPPDEKY